MSRSILGTVEDVDDETFAPLSRGLRTELDSRGSARCDLRSKLSQSHRQPSRKSASRPSHPTETSARGVSSRRADPVVSEELDAHELMQTKLRVRRLQAALAAEERLLTESAIEALSTPTPTADEARAVRGAEAAELRHLEKQIRHARQRLVESNGKLREALTDDRSLLALAVEDGVNNYFAETHQLRVNLREQHVAAAGAALPSSARSKLREEETRLQERVAHLVSDSLATTQRRSRSLERQQAMRDALHQQDDGF